ncbi:hypothetical protein PAAG_01614 [Paracoccidioides lutzii Pb01]|uniref:Uncharacterized protein n=1 Tax=Paracoccidioides lutzii (strain ATCC MYA-826 / Pb01) TaxID=502779 RepID=C1GSW9_PARBA|nr:hypothetical protein PAAG_01614 [Paracoccidioides lutzii Pb01]EEH39152.2 hypothetical protein PAAG_01614 [Paracoccidioides lutzii Pb01]
MMTAVDLLAFCQQMMMTMHQDSPINNSGAPVNDLKQKVREYQKEVKASSEMKNCDYIRWIQLSGVEG